MANFQNIQSSRSRLWILLSELWLDTEITPITRQWLAREMATLPYSSLDIREIHEAEVAPVLFHNLYFNPAGEWAGFDEEWLMQECHRCFLHKNRLWARLKLWLKRKAVRMLTEDILTDILNQMESIRNLKHSGQEE